MYVTIKGRRVRLVHHRDFGPVCGGIDYIGDESISQEAFAFLEKEQLDRCDHAIEARYAGAIIGFIRWDDYGDGVHLLGTFVEKEWRNCGLATALWRAAMRYFLDAEIEVTATSKAGAGLVRKMRTLEPKRTWDAYNAVRQRSISVRKPAHKAAK